MQRDWYSFLFKFLFISHSGPWTRCITKQTQGSPFKVIKMPCMVLKGCGATLLHNTSSTPTAPLKMSATRNISYMFVIFPGLWTRKRLLRRPLRGNHVPILSFRFFCFVIHSLRPFYDGGEHSKIPCSHFSAWT